MKYKNKISPITKPILINQTEATDNIEITSSLLSSSPYSKSISSGNLSS